MPKLPGNLLCFFAFVMLILPGCVRGQDTGAFAEVIDLLRGLEQRYQVRFSFVDEDLQGMQADLPADLSLEEALNELYEQTQLRIQRLNERYYTVAKSSTVSICASVFDNFEQNSIPGATVEVLGSSIALVTNADGMFRLENIPRQATLRIQHHKQRARVVHDGMDEIPFFFQRLTYLIPFFQEAGQFPGQRAQFIYGLGNRHSAFAIIDTLTGEEALQGIEALPEAHQR